MRLLLNSGLWGLFAILVALFATAGLRHDRGRAISCFYGSVVGVLGAGHIVAISYLGTDRWRPYAIGIAIAGPALVLAVAATRASYRTLQWLHAGPLAVLMFVPSAWVLVVPAVLNVLYLRKPRHGFFVANIVFYALIFVASVITAVIIGSNPSVRF